jgi:hypothetical protein
MFLKPLSRRGSLVGLAGAAAALPFSRPANPASASSNGLVVLTVGGLVGAPNRPAFDAAHDRFFDHNNLSFEKARAFSVADLTTLPQQAVLLKRENGQSEYKGPLLRDVLAAANPVGVKVARVSALDGYAVELTLKEIEAQKWILATEVDGSAFGIGDFGPLYAMRQLASNEEMTQEEGAKWVFSIYYIELLA